MALLRGLVLLAVLSVATCSSLGGRVQDPHLALGLKHPERAFRVFMTRFNRNYSTIHEYRHRLAVFQRNLLRAAQNQAQDTSAVHGVTKFADLTEDEFAQSYLGLSARPKFAAVAEARAEQLPTADLPEEFDWREKGAVTDVKNQGMCGSCYAFSAVGAVEGAHFLKTGELISLSEQQIVDCDRECDPEVKEACDAGCNGGLMNNVFSYVEKAGGLMTYKDYPYTGRPGACQFDTNKVATTVQKFLKVPVDEKQILANLVKYGPLAVAINAGFMQTYMHGVSCPYACDPHALNHGVLLVGYGKHGFAPARLKYKDFWVIKNSWGEDWGEQGYYRVCSGKDECGVDTMVSAVVAVDGEAGTRSLDAVVAGSDGDARSAV